MKLSHSLRAAFTLLEIMLVVAIIGLLAGAAIYSMAGNLGIAKEARGEADMQGIVTQLTVYESRNGHLPTTEQGLKALVVKPESEPKPRKWSKSFNEVPRDPWQREYHYLQPGTRNPDNFDLFSIGKDGLPGTADDIVHGKTAQ